MSLLKQLSDEDRPRERLLEKGAKTLSDAELIAVLLRTGRPGHSALEMARALLEERGGLAALATSDPSRLRRRGLGAAKAATLLAACELGRRMARLRVAGRSILDRPAAVASYLELRYGSLDQEVLGALYLDSHHRLIAESDVYRGTLDHAVVEPRAILKEGLLRSATGMMLFHNHPSGVPLPSEDDFEFTHRMAAAGELVGIRLVDHLILGSGGRWLSLRHRQPW